MKFIEAKYKGVTYKHLFVTPEGLVYRKEGNNLIHHEGGQNSKDDNHYMRFEGKYIHRMIMETLYPDMCPADIPESGWKQLPSYVKDLIRKTVEVDHINEIKYDNRLDNLEWVTPTENRRRYFGKGVGQ